MTLLGLRKRRTRGPGTGPGPGRRFTRTDLILAAFCLSILGVLVLYPTLRLVGRALSSWTWEVFSQGQGARVLANTLVIALGSVLTAGTAGTVLALVVARYEFPGRRTLAALAYLPFALPPLVGVLSFYYIIGRNGFIARGAEHLFGIRGLSLQGAWAILLIHTYSFYVFFYAMVSAALEGADPSQMEAARTLGAGRTYAFRRVMLPMLRPALAGAALLTFMTASASFSAPYFFGRDFSVLTVRIYEEQTNFREAEALSLTVTLGALAFVGFALFRSARRSARTGGKGVRAAVRGRRGRFAACAFAWCCIALVLTPHAVILWLSFVDHRAWFTEVIPRGLTLANYASLFNNPRAFAPIRNSLWMSAVAAGACLLTALPAGFLTGKRRPGGRAVNALVMVPWALPGTVIAMNLIVAANDASAVAGSAAAARAVAVAMLPLAYFVRNVPLLTRMTTAAIEPFDPTLLEAGRTLGASRAYCFRRVVLPLLAPAIAAGCALVFATCLGEFVASILLYQPSNIPISVQINMEWRGSGLGEAFAYSVLLMVLVTATFLGARRFGSWTL